MMIIYNIYIYHLTIYIVIQQIIVSLQPGFLDYYQIPNYNYQITICQHMSTITQKYIQGHLASASASASAAGSASASASCGRWRRWKQKLGELWGKRWLIVGCYGLLWFILVYCVFFMFYHNSLWVHCSQSSHAPSPATSDSPPTFRWAARASRRAFAEGLGAKWWFLKSPLMTRSLHFLGIHLYHL